MSLSCSSVGRVLDTVWWVTCPGYESPGFEVRQALDVFVGLLAGMAPARRGLIVLLCSLLGQDVVVNTAFLMPTAKVICPQNIAICLGKHVIWKDERVKNCIGKRGVLCCAVVFVPMSQLKCYKTEEYKILPAEGCR